MDDMVDLDGLERMDDVEVDDIRGLVSGLFGPFEANVFIDGVHFGERRYPHTVYRSRTNRFHVSVCLPKHQADNPLARLINLSHELVHCLNPNGPPPQATVFEEGLAEHSKIYLGRAFYQDQHPDFDFRDLSTGAYREAFDMIEELVRYEGLEGMRQGVRSVRASTGLPFCRITAKHLAETFLQTPQRLLNDLSGRFND